VGVGQERVGVRLFEGDAQRAILLVAGPFLVGFRQRPALRQSVLGYESLSLSFVERANGATEVGLGFVFRGLLRNVQRTSVGWQWQPPLPKGAIEEPHLRWPGLASLLY
jgi:hypothetical protein